MITEKLQSYHDFIQKQLPENIWLQSTIVLALAALPFAPAHYIAKPLAFATVTFSSVALVFILLRAYFVRDQVQQVVDAKRLGVTVTNLEEMGLHNNPLQGIVRLLLVVLFIGCGVVVSFSSITYSYINHPGADGPFFGVKPSIAETLLFFGDQALRGMVFDFFEVFEISIQDRLRINASVDVQFGLMLVVYRLILALLTIQVLSSALRHYLAKEDPRLVQLAEARWRQTPQFATYLRLLDAEDQEQEEHDREMDEVYGDGVYGR